MPEIKGTCITKMSVKTNLRPKWTTGLIKTKHNKITIKSKTKDSLNKDEKIK